MAIAAPLAADVASPEGMAAIFASNPDLARRNPGAVRQVHHALSAKKTATEAHQRAHTATAKATGRPASAGNFSRTITHVEAAQRALAGHMPGRTSVVGRLIVASFLGILVLELVSYLSGQYFNYNLKDAPANAGKALGYVPLYKGQSSPATGPASGAEPSASLGASAAAAAAAAAARASNPYHSILPGPGHGNLP